MNYIYLMAGESLAERCVVSLLVLLALRPDLRKAEDNGWMGKSTQIQANNTATILFSFGA